MPDVPQPIVAVPGAVEPKVAVPAISTQKVPELTVAAFDFDGTITRGGSTFKFLVAAAGRSRAVAVSIRLLPLLATARLRGGAAVDRAKEALISRTLAGIHPARLRQAGEQFAALHLARHTRSDTLTRLDWHKTKGHRIVVVSASLDCYVRPAAAILGADDAIATRLKFSEPPESPESPAMNATVQERGPGAEITGSSTTSCVAASTGAGSVSSIGATGFDGPNCRGAEKARRLQVWMAGLRSAPGRPNNTTHPGREPDPPATATGPSDFPGPAGIAGNQHGTPGHKDAYLWAYGNSAGDREMLEMADVAVDMGRFAVLRRFLRLGSLSHFPPMPALRSPEGPAPAGGTSRRAEPRLPSDRR